MPKIAEPRNNLSDQVTQHLISYIRSNKLRSGAAVPSEISVSSDLGVSRGIVREAFRALKMAGILEINNGRAPRVGRINEDGLAHLLDHALSTDQATIEQVLDLRAAIEVRAAELAAANRSDKHVVLLQKESANMHALKDQRDAFIEADARFHEAIGHATGNPLFELVGAALRDSLKASIRAGLQNRVDRSELDQLVETHKHIALAIGDRDALQARKYMTIHFEEALRSFH